MHHIHTFNCPIGTKPFIETDNDGKATRYGCKINKINNNK